MLFEYAERLLESVSRCERTPRGSSGRKVETGAAGGAVTAPGRPHASTLWCIVPLGTSSRLLYGLTPLPSPRQTTAPGGRTPRNSEPPAQRSPQHEPHAPPTAHNHPGRPGAHGAEHTPHRARPHAQRCTHRRRHRRRHPHQKHTDTAPQAITRVEPPANERAARASVRVGASARVTAPGGPGGTYNSCAAPGPLFNLSLTPAFSLEQ